MDCAVIYAAGRATRLGPTFANTPKILLPVAGRSLLDRHAEHLATVGIRNLFIVTGHCREQIAAVIPEISARHGIRIYELHNPDFAEGSVISMYVSLSMIETSSKSVLVMDGDVLYGPALLRLLIDSPRASTMLVDFGVEAQDDDPVLVPIRNDRPFDLVKKWTGNADRVGESVGFFKIGLAHLPMLAAETRARTVGIRRRDSLDEVLRALTVAGLFGYEDVTGQPWTEIDFPHDVAYARDVVMPALARESAASLREHPAGDSVSD